MSVAEDLSAYSTAAASNTPAGTDNIGTDLDDHLRDIKKNLKNAYAHRAGPSSPDSVEGRIWADTSGSASAVTDLRYGTGSADVRFAQINATAGTSKPYFDGSLPGTVGAAVVKGDTTASILTTLGLHPGSGLKTGTGTLVVDVPGLTAETSLDSADSILTFDASLSANRQVTIANMIVALLASQAQVEAASVNDRFVSPGRVKNNPGVAKAWAEFSGSGTARVVASHNMTVDRSAVGKYAVQFTTPFSSANAYMGLYWGMRGEDDPGPHLVRFDDRSAGGGMLIGTDNGTTGDVKLASAVFYGDQ